MGLSPGSPTRYSQPLPTDIAYWSAHFKTYMFVVSDGTLIAHIMLSMFIGSLVALTAKGREMVATMTLSLILGTMTGMVYVASIAQLLAAEDTLWWMLAQLAGPFAIVVGGAIVRSRRSTSTTVPSDA